MVAVCVLVINIGYGFKGIGKPLGAFDFTCDTLTDDRTPPVPAYKDDPDFRSLDLKAGVLQFRVNRFRDTPLGALPVPLPEPYVLGFDDQKLEAEGVPVRAMMLVDDPRGQGISRYEISGYPVYLDGERRNRSWWYYYIMTLVYKVPEGTWLLVMLSIAVLPAARRARSAPVDEAALWVVPAVVVLVMSFGTNIAIGLRYVLGIFPYLFIAAGRLAPWAMGLQRRGVKALGIALIASALTATVSASLLIHPHYIAYFNWASGGPARGSEHLIDSNLDWGQDLVGLRRWLDENAPGERVGIAYFGQINPETFNLESQASGGPRVLDWFLPPVRPGTLPERPAQASGPPEPGLYAVSASLTRGLPWRIYVPDRWAPLSAKSATDRAGNEYGAFDYFAGLEPIGHVGYSIFLYRIDAEDAKRLARFWQGATVAP
jgi:hypothetical protein